MEPSVIHSKWRSKLLEPSVTIGVTGARTTNAIIDDQCKWTWAVSEDQSFWSCQWGSERPEPSGWQLAWLESSVTIRATVVKATGAVTDDRSNWNHQSDHRQENNIRKEGVRMNMVTSITFVSIMNATWIIWSETEYVQLARVTSRTWGLISPKVLLPKA